MKKLNSGKRASAALILCAATAVALPAQTFKVMHNFAGTDGQYPEATVVQGTDGNFYGTTEFGGVNGDGVVYRMSPQGTLTTLQSFDYTDGFSPQAPLLQATDGNFYSTTLLGGAYGAGVIFKITPSGTLSDLESWDYTDGYATWVGLIQATDGNFYGTTYYGGAYGEGTVFRVTPGGVLTTLHSFEGGMDGGQPGGVIQATDGNFYGTAQIGGANDEGTVFKITAGGTLTTLYSFCSQSNCADGSTPWNQTLVQALDGNFYGTTANGGAYGGGTIFSITATGTLSTLYSFCSQTGCTDGEVPGYAQLIQATDGNLYGNTLDGGAYGDGTIFKLTLGGVLTTLHSFDGADGSTPKQGLFQATNGMFYGTTSAGGTSNYGTVFMLSMGLRPFAETEATSGRVGMTVRILGNNLTGATSVTFNGTPAVFKVMSPSWISTSVPTGATTGTVQVTTPSGTLSSNVPFRVMQ